MRSTLLVCVASVVGLAVGCGSSASNETVTPKGTDDVPAGTDDAGSTTAGPIKLTVGEKTLILISGTVMTPKGPIEGEVLVDGSTLSCVGKTGTCASLAKGATTIKTEDIISPGLIDTHNHILYDVFDNDDWVPSMSYTNHNGWTKEERYAEMADVKQCLEDASQGKPTWCPAQYDGAGNLKCEMNKWGELKGLIAGTTAIVGLPGLELECYSTIARSIDTRFNGLELDSVQASALTSPSKTTADGVCKNFASGKTAAYLIHCGEGTDEAALEEFNKLANATTTPGCLIAAQTTITHGTAFGQTEFDAMKAAGMKLTWSPASNVALYGSTANIPMALDTGITIALAPDWSMGGSQNLLDELRFAESWDKNNWSSRLTQKEIFQMVTTNAATVLALDTKLGSLAKGAMADVVIFKKQGDDPYASIFKATPADVRMTMIGGKILYGDSTLKAIANSTPETLKVCGVSKFLAITEDASTGTKVDQTYAQIKALLDQGMLDADSARSGGGAPFSPVAPLVRCPGK